MINQPGKHTIAERILKRFVSAGILQVLKSLVDLIRNAFIRGFHSQQQIDARLDDLLVFEKLALEGAKLCPPTS